MSFVNCQEENIELDQRSASILIFRRARRALRLSAQICSHPVFLWRYVKASLIPEKRYFSRRAAQQAFGRQKTAEIDWRGGLCQSMPQLKAFRWSFELRSSI